MDAGSNHILEPANKKQNTQPLQIIDIYFKQIAK